MACLDRDLSPAGRTWHDTYFIVSGTAQRAAEAKEEAVAVHATVAVHAAVAGTSSGTLFLDGLNKPILAR